MPPTVILLERGAERRDRYLTQGATVLVHHGVEDQILGAVSELTGPSFRQSPRVPFSTVVDVALGGEHSLRETVDLSTSGVTIRGLDHAKVGMSVSLNFLMTEPPLSLGGVVSRVLTENGETLAGLWFHEMTADVRGALQRLVELELHRMPVLPDPVGLTDESAGTFSLDLIQQLDNDASATQAYVHMLRDHDRKTKHRPRLPRWLERIAARLTPIERAAVGDQPAPPFALGAVEMRIRLHRTRIDNEASREAECIAALDFCQALVAEADGESEDTLLQVTEIRSALLYAIYAAPSEDGLDVINIESLDEAPAHAHA